MDVVQEKLDDFFLKQRQELYKKGSIIIRPGTDPSGIFFIKKGQVKMYAVAPNGDELALNIFKPGAFFPMTWGINNTPNRYYFEAITDVELWCASKEDTLAFLKDTPEVLFDLLRRLFSGMDGVIKRMEYIMVGSAYNRLITELLIAADRFGKKQKDGTISVILSGKDLGALTGMTRETISRVMKKLKEKNLVHHEQKEIIIVDRDKLNNELTAI